jgi:hypothetical protein
MVEEGPEVTHIYRFRNTGTGPLQITGVHPSCGCTAADYTKTPIPPGGSGIIKVGYNTQGRPGNATKTVTVNTNDPSQPSLTLTFTVNVTREVDYQPSSAYFYAVRKGQTRSVTIHVLGRPGTTLKVLGAEARHKKVGVVLSPLTQSEDPAKPSPSRDRRGAALEVTVPPDLPYGAFTDEIVVKTSHPKKPEIIIPVSGKVVGRVQLSPDDLVFPNLTTPVTVVVLVDPPQGFAVRGVSTEKKLVKPWVQRERQPGGAADLFRIVVTPPKPGKVPVGEFQDTLIVKTNDPEQPEVTLPLRGRRDP